MNGLANKLEGFLLVCKPVGISSFKVIHKLRAVTGIKKIGHCGTLDPFATGLLIVALGRAYTKRISELQNLPKEYTATMVLGLQTDTYDREGSIIKKVIPNLSKKEISEAITSFKGKIKQVPPSFSAKKIKGKKAYELARKGIMVKLEPKEIEIFDLKVLEIKTEQTYPSSIFHVKCSKGTYIRSLASDIGEKLGVGAHLSDLIRTKIGPYALANALDYDKLEPELIEKGIWKTFDA
jgi:tRNA pseudouridine55 synthase